MSVRENYSSSGKPSALARKALNIIKKSKPSGTNLKVFEIKERGDSFIAIGRSEDGLLHDSEIQVTVRPAYGEGSIFEVEANDEKFGKLLVKMRREL